MAGLPYGTACLVSVSGRQKTYLFVGNFHPRPIDEPESGDLGGKRNPEEVLVARSGVCGEYIGWGGTRQFTGGV